MEFSLKAKGITLTAAINAAVAKAVTGLEKKVTRFGDSVSCEVEVGKTSKHHKKGLVFRAEIHVRLPGKLVYAEAVSEDLYVAINTAKREADKQIANYKGVHGDEKRRLAQKSRGGRE